MNSAYNPNKSSWYNPNIEYLFAEEIIEYDMRDAGFTIIQQFKLLGAEEIKRLQKLEKLERIIAIGKLQRDNKELAKALNDRFTEMRSVFIASNKITDDQIVCVKKDAIYTIGTMKELKFGKVEFVTKKRYTSYIRFTENLNIEVFYNGGEMDLKGLGERGENRHRLYLLTFINRVIAELEARNPSVKRYMKKFISDYKGGKMDDEYYLEFNNLSREANALHN
jgi:hypothetical protein